MATICTNRVFTVHIKSTAVIIITIIIVVSVVSALCHTIVISLNLADFSSLSLSLIQCERSTQNILSYSRDGNMIKIKVKR